MSGSVRRRVKADGDDDNEEEEDEDCSREGIIGRREREKQRQQKKRTPLHRRVVLLSFRKFQKHVIKRKSSAPHHPRSNFSFSRIGNYFCCSCLSQPQTVDNAVDSSPQKRDDPDDPETSYEALKALIEKNDFYAKECNTHFSD
ncbi:hypothetical protein Nepgr_016814 [Nepenthes gracilis]|uniref:Uncharacterized protein n=1 Tax=Nepenthes gracilis TaxID=150966 RepID=A0AAD3SNB3_NEPGR|nr:hypothetical protein Nepgr_016814 [Nepenthes gracilis]